MAAPGMGSSEDTVQAGRAVSQGQVANGGYRIGYHIARNRLVTQERGRYAYE